MADLSEFTDQADVFKAVANEKRLWILKRATEGPVAAPDLAKELEVSPESVLHHLQQLEAAGFLVSHTVRGPGNRPRNEFRLQGDGRRLRLEIIEDDFDYEFSEPPVFS